MLKYTCKYWNVLAPLVKKSLKKHYGKAFADKTMIKARSEYRAMLERVDDIGADNPMASNIYMSFVFLAVYQAADSKITVNALRKISHEAISWKPLKLMGIFMNANKPSGINAIRKMMQKNAEWIEMHPQAFYYRDHNDVRSNADYDEKSEKERCKCITY